MAKQAGIWSVIWLKCMENGQWPPTISDSVVIHAIQYMLVHVYTCAQVYVHVIGVKINKTYPMINLVICNEDSFSSS